MEMNEMIRPLAVRRLGVVPYAEALALQAELVQKRRIGEIADTLLLLEHPHVITLGSGAHQENILLTNDERVAAGIELFDAGRGGDVTYHGPGQLVGYPILHLEAGHRDLHGYLRDLEEVLIRVLERFGLAAARKEGLTGAWVGHRKLAAIGVRVSSGWITSHGFALNVDPELRYFQAIIPCGIRDHGVGSIARELARPVAMDEVEREVVRQFRGVFGHHMPDGDGREALVQTAGSARDGVKR
jgi:lipoyl(octanoyl) transferase